MGTSPQPFIAAAHPARIARVSNTTLFHLAETYLGNALLWTFIAKANGLSDPWITGEAAIRIPNNVVPPIAPTGLLGV